MTNEKPAEKAKARDIGEIRRELSEIEYRSQREKIDKALHAVDEVGEVLGSALFLRNGALSTGHIKYAAFRVQTLSLIFDLARKHFVSAGKDGAQRYERYLEDVGEEVGLTFARELMGRLMERGLLREVQSVRRLLQLWTLFENETGAGVTTVQRADDREGHVVIRLEKNPLRAVESQPHAHCTFYCAYIRSLLNELLSLRARRLAEEFADATFKLVNAPQVEERSGVDDACIFETHLKTEELQDAFGQLDRAFTAFEERDLGGALISARAAVISAQCGKLGMDPKSSSPQLYKVFKHRLPRPDDHKRMHDVYHRASFLIHPEGRTPDDPSEDYVYNILKDVRHVVYSIEFADIDASEAKALSSGILMDSLDSLITKLDEIVQQAKDLDPSERDEIVQHVRQLRKAGLGEAERSKTLTWLRERFQGLKGPTSRVAVGVVTELLSASLKRGSGLD